MKHSLRILVVVALTTLAADQVTKYLAVAHLTEALDGQAGLERVEGFLSPMDREVRWRSRPHRFIENYWHFRYVENPGAAWGLFDELPDAVRRPFFHVVSLVAMGFILFMYVRLEPSQRLVRWALALVMGGALGNFVDRLLRGYVIDFIDWHWRNQPGMHWPTFNVADVAICVGVGLLLVDSFRTERPAEPVTPGGQVV
jgi:signal peptidase II